MAFKSLKQKWLQQFQELQHDQKFKSSSSTHGEEGSTQHQGPAADAASKPTPQQRLEQGAKTSNSHATGRPQEAGNRKQRPQDAARPASEIPAKRKRDQEAAEAPAVKAKLLSPAARREQQQEQQQAKPARRDAGAAVARAEPAAAAAARDGRQTQRQQQQARARPESLVAVKNEAASAGSNPSTSAAATQQQGAGHEGGAGGSSEPHQQEAASVRHPPPPRVKQEPGAAAAAEGGSADPAGGVAAPPPAAAVEVPVEVEARPSAKAQRVGELAMSAHGSYEELVAVLQAEFGEQLPKRPGMRLVYQDGEGDWLLLLPDVPWPLFVGSVRRLLVTYK